MRIYTFILTAALFLLPDSGYSQDRKKVKRDAKNLSFYNSVIDKNDKSFDIYSAPEEWKDESYVILSNNLYLNVGSKKNKIRGINRKRVLLQDQNAVDFFTEFYFKDSETNLITLTKKNGEELEISIKDAIKVSTDVPSFYSSRFQSSQSYKLAIPNLEIGDIIDFTYIYSQEFGTMLSLLDFLSNSKPILHQNITIDINKYWDVYRNTFNTNDKFELHNGKGHSYDGTPDNTMNRFSLISNKMDASTGEIWKNTYETEPIMKFLGISPDDNTYYVGKGQINDKIDASFILKRLVASYFSFAEYYGKATYEVLQIIKKNVSKNDSPKEKADACYYYLREFINKKYHPQVAIKSIKSEGQTYESIYGRFSSLDEMNFFYLFTALLRNMDVDAKLVAIFPEKMGNINNVVTINELYYGVCLASDAQIYWPLNKNSTHLDLPYELMSGGNGLSLEIKSNKRKDESKADIIYIKPVSAKHNSELNEMSFYINMSENTTNITRKMSVSGYHKSTYKGFIEEFGDNMYLDFLSMYFDKDFESDHKEYEVLVNKDKKGIYEDFIQKSDKNMADAFKAWVEENDSKTTISSYETISNGRTSIQPEMEVEVSYTSDAFFKVLGPNLILDIGKIIGSQVFIEEKSKSNRTYSTQMDAPRLFEYQIEINIPDAYYIENMDVLNKSVTNEYCSFISKATMEGNKLKVSTKKSYDKTFVPKDAWHDVTKVMDEAYKFSQEKIILKRR